jgi:3-oxoacyl-(acyl-carrier-protein) synthase
MHEDEKFFNPTPFIQSTYNTISSQVAITLKCHGYNSTYVHRNFSFESTLQDALMQLDEKIAKNVLAGGIDEMTLNHLAITLRAGHWKKEKISNLNLLSSKTAGSLAGEGAGFFVLSSERSASTYATLRAVKTFYKPGTTENIEAIIGKFLSQQSLAMPDIDIILLGLNGDSRYDPVYYELMDSLFREQTIAYYKHLCGEYFTSTAFALWMAANILKRQFLPEITVVRKTRDLAPANILIYNQYHNTNHSLILLSA